MTWHKTREAMIKESFQNMPGLQSFWVVQIIIGAWLIAKQATVVFGGPSVKN